MRLTATREAICAMYDTRRLDRPRYLAALAEVEEAERRVKVEYATRMDTREMLEAAEAERDRMDALYDEAEQRLTAMEAEVETLRAGYDKSIQERDRLRAHVARHREQMDGYERLEAERDRLLHTKEGLKADLDTATRIAMRQRAENERLKRRLMRITNPDILRDDRLARDNERLRAALREHHAVGLQDDVLVGDSCPICAALHDDEDAEEDLLWAP